MSDWETLSSEDVYETPWIKVRRDQAVSIASITSTFFLARNAYPSKGKRDEDEPISDRKFMPLAEIEALARDGKIQEMPLLAGLYLAQLHGI